VAHAVACEPVSVCEFPANREFYREFCKIVASGGPETVNNWRRYRPSDANSLLNGTGNSFRRTTIHEVRTANFIDEANH